MEVQWKFAIIDENSVFFFNFDFCTIYIPYMAAFGSLHVGKCIYLKFFVFNLVVVPNDFFFKFLASYEIWLVDLE